MARRGDNIRKRADGRWEGRYSIRSESGGKHYRSVYGKSYSEVKEKLTGVIHGTQNMGAFCGNDETAEGEKAWRDVDFCALVEEWLCEIEKSRKYSTYIKYKTIYQCHIQPLFSGDTFPLMNNGHIQNRIAVSEKSDSIRHSMLAVIKQTLRYAEKQYGWPVPSITNIFAQNRSHSIDILKRSEQAKLMQFLHKDMDISKAGIFLCLSTGLRLGEICSLKWIDIDPECKLLHVNRTVQRIKSMEGPSRTVLLETTPKSVFSNREIPIPDTLLSLLMNFKMSGQEYILCKDKPMEPRTYQNRFKRYLGQIMIPDYNFHALRHTFATNCIDSGMDIKSLSEILGHSNVQITLDRYVHPSMDTKRKYIDALSAEYGQLYGQTGQGGLLLGTGG